MRIVFVALLSLVVLLIRIPDAVNEPRFWAEDGVLFFPQWRAEGIFSLWQPYAGYLLLAPRMVAGVAAVFPLEWTAFIFLTMTIIVTIWVSITIARSIDGVVGMVASIAPLIAYGSNETLGSPTNLQWLLAVGLAVVAGEKFSNHWKNRAAFVVVAGLTGPFIVFAFPAFAVRAFLAYRSNRRRELSLALLAMGTGCVQASVMVATSVRETVETSNLLPLIADIFRYVLGRPDWIFVGFTGVIFLVGFLAGSGRWQRLAMASVSAAIILSTAAKFSGQMEALAGGANGQRYWSIPSATAIIIFLTMIRERSIVLRCLGCAGCLVLLLNASFGELRRHESAALESWPEAVERSREGPTTYRFPPGWSVTLP